MKLWWKNKKKHLTISATVFLVFIVTITICSAIVAYNVGIARAEEGAGATTEPSEEECEGESTTQEQITNALVYYRSLQALQSCSTLYGFYNQNEAASSWTPENVGNNGGPYYIETGTDGGQNYCTSEHIDELSKRAGFATSFLEAARAEAGCDFESSCDNNISISQIRNAITEVINSGSNLDIGGGSDIYRFRMIYDTFVIQCTDGGFSKADDNTDSSDDSWALESGPYLSKGEYLLAKVTAKKSCGGLFNSCDSTTTIGPTMPETIPGLTLTDAQRNVLQNNNKQYTMSCNEMNDALEGSGGEYITSRKCAGDDLEDLTDIETSPSEVVKEDPGTCHSELGLFGWILCNGVNLLNDIITGFLTWIDGQLNWTFLAQNSGEIITRWQDFVNIANVLFVIAFLVMIYSMATLTGLSNYDVKKMLPRLIIVAAAVNLSFYICAALADLSNIAGSGLYNLLSGGADAIHVEINLDDALVAGVVLIVTVIAAFAFIGSGLIAIILIFACLYLRQVALIILTIVSPIALVCYLLPNTEQWTKKWFNWYTRMLLIYPMFAAVWGGSLWLANTITSTSLGSSETMPIPDFVPQMICLVIPAVSIVPLFKASGGLMGMVSNRVAGGLARTGMANRINNTARKPVKAVGRGVGRTATNNFVTRAATGAVGSGAGHLASKMNHGIGKPFARGLYGLSNKANTHAGYVSAQAKAIDDQAMTQAKSDLSQMSQADLMTIATTGMYNNKVADEHILRAATEMSQDNMDEDDVKNMLVSRAKMAKELADKGRKDEAQRLLDNAANGAKKSEHYAGAGGALDRDFRNGNWGNNAEQAYNNAVAKKYSRMSAEQIANTSSSTLEHMNEAVKGATGSDRDAAISNIKASQQAIAQNANLQNKMSNKAMEELRNGANLGTDGESS